MKTRLFTFIRFVVLLIVSLVWAVPLLWALWAAIRPASMVTKFNLRHMRFRQLISPAKSCSW